MIKMIKQISLMLISAGLLLILGGFASVDFDVYKLSTVIDEEVVYRTETIPLDEIRKLTVSVSYSDLVIETSPTDDFVITYPESESLQYNLNVTSNRIDLEKKSVLKLMNWFTITDREDTVVTIQVPKAFKGVLAVNGSHGDAQIKDLQSLSMFTVDYKYGDCWLTSIDAESVSLQFAHGKSVLENFQCESLSIEDGYMESEYDTLKISEDLRISSSHGSVEMSNVEADLMRNDFNYSSLTIADSKFAEQVNIIMAHEDAKIKTSSMAGLCVDGNYVNLQLQDNDVQSIYVDLRHGDVEGTLKGAEDEYSTNAVVTHGDANISSQYREGAKYELDLMLDYSNAKLSFMK
ncbi:DUF4097 family beta strand repeat-containing protein [Dielma fastidiosa]|uniref:DUF4097 domain-containing protein n=1 Tax=Dielma fastidiosa TaxID=1034346 RepID=A0AB35URT3_9FIRM|nr:DUF4097 family beta strand repeat-containing protein [Dielma fastidiosa]MDY5169460.1 DUF4097 domain-containing protein [Dielma fastidiosa]